MKINELFLQNFRCFESLSIRFDPFLTVLVGENGKGKTAILDVIAIALGRLPTRLPKIKGVSFKDTDLRINDHNKPAPFTHYWIYASDFSGESIRWSHGKKRDLSEKTKKEILNSIIDPEKVKPGFKEIDRFANQLIDLHNSDQGYSMPVIAYYGTNRANLEEVQRRRNFRKEFSRFESLVSALDPNRRFAAVYEWFNAMEYLELNRRQELRNFDYTLPELDAVRRAIESMLPGYSHPRTEIRPRRFVIDRKLDDGTVRSYRISQLSDGYRVMLGLVMDLARRMAQANPPFVHEVDDGQDITDPLNSRAIVLIDEVDLHLHPGWQQRVLADLRRTFPNTQFIVTTHSPQVLSTVRRENIRIIGVNRQGQMIAEPPLAMTYGEPSGDVLHSVMMVDPQPPVKEKADLLRLTELVDQGTYAAKEARQLMQKLADSLGERHPQLQRLQRSIQRQEALKR